MGFSKISQRMDCHKISHNLSKNSINMLVTSIIDQQNITMISILPAESLMMILRFGSVQIFSTN